MSQYYLYRHVRPDLNVPFYIGIGTKSDIRPYRRATNKKGRSELWKKIFNKCGKSHPEEAKKNMRAARLKYLESKKSSNERHSN